MAVERASEQVQRRGPVLLADVARAAGVSLATASRVLNGSERVVGEPLRSRVVAAAADLGYRPNAHAQAVARGASNVVGLLVHDIADPYFSAIANGVMRQAEHRGMVVVLASTRRDPARELQYVSTLHSQRAQAIIVAGSRTADRDQTKRLAKELAAFTDNGGRAACIGQNRLGTHTVLPLNRAGARGLARSLCALGHERFVALAGPAQLLTAHDRLTGFLDGLAQEGVDRDRTRVVRGPFTRDGGHAAASRLVSEGVLGRREGPTCVFAVNDVMAVGAMAAFRQAGLSVPLDVSVAGFDDIETLRDLAPALSTVHLPLESMGERAAELALDGAVEGPARVVRVPGEVRLRESTRSLH